MGEAEWSEGARMSIRKPFSRAVGRSSGGGRGRGKQFDAEEGMMEDVG